MRASAEPLEGNKVKLRFEVDEAEIDVAIDKAFKKFATQVRIPGFRPGKAPRKILESHIGLDAARAQAINDALPEFYAKALKEADVDAIDTAKVDIVEGEQSGPVTFAAEVDVRPVPDIHGYGGLEVTVPTPEAKDEDIDAEIERMRARDGELELVERPAVAGDFVTLDLSGTRDGDPVPGLTATDYSYEVGNPLRSFGDDFDSQVEGASVGDTREFTSTIPPSDEEVDFRLEIKAVNERRLPEPTNEWVNDASEFETIEELRADIASQLATVRRAESERQLRNQSIKAVAELVDGEMPETLVNQESNRQLRDIVNRLAQQGIDIGTFLEISGQTEESFIDQIRLNAHDSVRADLALRSLADKENLQATDEDVEEEIQNLAVQFGQKPDRVRHDLIHADQMAAVRSDIRKGKAVRWLMDHVEITDVDGNKIDRSVIGTDETAASDTDAGLRSPVSESDSESDVGQRGPVLESDVGQRGPVLEEGKQA